MKKIDYLFNWTDLLKIFPQYTYYDLNKINFNDFFKLTNYGKKYVINFAVDLFCKYNCNICKLQNYFNKEYNFDNLENILINFLHNIDNYSYQVILFHIPLQEKLYSFFNKINNEKFNNIQIQFFVQPNKETLNFLKQYKKIHNHINLRISLESVDNYILKNIYNMPHTFEEFLKFIDYINMIYDQKNINVNYINLSFNIYKDLEKLLKLLKKYKKINLLIYRYFIYEFTKNNKGYKLNNNILNEIIEKTNAKINNGDFMFFTRYLNVEDDLIKNLKILYKNRIIILENIFI